MAPKKKEDNRPPEFMTINGQQCKRVKDASTGKFVYRPVAQPQEEQRSANDDHRNRKKDEAEEKRWLQEKEREVQELRLRESQQQSAQQRRHKEKVGLLEKVPSRRKEPKVPVPGTLRKLREENKAALIVGMNTTKPSQYALIKEALEIEEARYQAKVKEAKERAYKKTRSSLRVAGADGLNDSGSDFEEEDEALVPRQELHDIDDYRRDVLPSKGPSAKLWNSGANGAQAAQVDPPSAAATETKRSGPTLAKGPRQAGDRSLEAGGQKKDPIPVAAVEESLEGDGVSMKELAEALPQGDKGQGRGGQGRARGRGWGRGRRGGGGPLPSDEAAKIGGCHHPNDEPPPPHHQGRGRGRGHGGWRRGGRGGAGRGGGGGTQQAASLPAVS